MRKEILATGLIGLFLLGNVVGTKIKEHDSTNEVRTAEQVAVTQIDNEYDIYEHDFESYTAPVKAVRVNDNTHILTDLRGEIHVVHDWDMKDNHNYVIWVELESGEILDYTSSHEFEFTYEEEFLDEEFMQEEIEGALSLMFKEFKKNEM